MLTGPPPKFHETRDILGDAGVAVLVVVPAEEPHAVRSSSFDRDEPAWKVGPVLQSLELRLAERVVVGDVGSGV
jgi:hypothetical protein